MAVRICIMIGAVNNLGDRNRDKRAQT